MHLATGFTCALGILDYWLGFSSVRLLISSDSGPAARRGQQSRNCSRPSAALLRERFAHLPPHCQRLIGMLIHYPPAPDAEISAKPGISAGSSRRNCRACLEKLRRYPAIGTLIHADAKHAGSKRSGAAAVLL